MSERPRIRLLLGLRRNMSPLWSRPPIAAVAIALVVAVFGCADREFLAPGVAAQALTKKQAASIQITYACGTRFLVSNPNAQAAEVQYEVFKTAESGVVLLPAAPAPETPSETEFTSIAVGTVRLYYGNTYIGSAANDGTTCPPPTVPDIAPEAAAVWMYSGDSVTQGSLEHPGWFIRNSLKVLFRRGTTLAEKVEAITFVGGEVVGGERVFSDDGFYYVHIATDGTVDSLVRAVDALSTLPSVAVAEPLKFHPPQEAYRRAADGPGFQSWVINPRHADGPNWGLEAIRAPMAWGCSIGSSSVKIAVVDVRLSQWKTDGTTPVPDLENIGFINTPPRSGVDAVPVHSDHGVPISGVIAATANNGVGITGVMWHADVEWFDELAHPRRDGVRLEPIELQVGDDTVSISESWMGHVERAAERGAQVINLSKATPWQGSRPNDGSTAAQENAYYATKQYHKFRELIQRIADKGRHPLFIVAAGNDNLPAYNSGYARAVLDFPNQVIVVGATARTQPGDAIHKRFEISPTAGSNYDLVDVYAPGHDIHSIAASTTPEPNYFHTSFAAPFVTGVAGLVLAFDSQITPAEVKQIIMEGSREAGQRVEGTETPFLDAYGALRRAAQRPGAPLCGNRVIMRPRLGNSGTDVLAERNPSQALELIAGYDVFSSGAPMIHHGGRRFDDWFTLYSFRYDEGQRRFVQDGTTDTRPFNDGDDGGSYNSANGITHDGARIFGLTVPEKGRFVVRKSDYHSSTMEVVGNWSQVTEINVGTDYDYLSFNAPISAEGDTMFVALHTPTGGRYIGLDLANQSVFPLFVADAASTWYVDWLAVSEDGREMVAREYLQTGDPGFTACRLIFRNMDTNRRGDDGQPVALGALLRPADSVSCAGDYFNGAISPVISAPTTRHPSRTSALEQPGPRPSLRSKGRSGRPLAPR